ncbi:MAG: tetratricopeptide repeat protein [Candidatus Binataceae bacterium]
MAAKSPRLREEPVPAAWSLGGDLSPRAWMAALLVVAGLIYSRCLSAQFVLDDFDWANNPFIGKWSFIWKSFVNDAWWFLDPKHAPQSSYYRPFLDIWAALNFHLFGVDPIGWHAAMIAISLLVVWQVFRVASLLAGDEWTGLLAATLFALMPAHAESIVWPSAICQPLYAAFALGTFEFYLRRQSLPASDARRTRWLAISLSLFAGALLTYETAVVLPVLIAVHAWLFQRPRDLTPCPPSPLGKGERNSESSPLPLGGGVRGGVGAALPYLVAVAAYLCVRIAVLGFISRPYTVKHITGIEAILTLPSAIATYAMLMAFPWMAAPAHRLDAVQSIASPQFYLPIFGLAAVCAAGWLLLRRHPRRMLYLFCAAWILIAFAPMLNLEGLFAESLIQDRYLYFPSFGFCLMAADLAVWFAQESERRAKAIRIGAAIVAAIYAVFLFNVERFWHDNITLYTRCIAATPEVGIWHYRLGRALAARGDFAGARRQLEMTVGLEPNAGGNILFDLGLIEEKLGDSHAAAGDLTEGIRRFTHPRLVAFKDVAIADDAAGDAAGAESMLKRLESMPGGPEVAALARAQLMSIHGDAKGAEAALRKLLNRGPGNPHTMEALGAVLSSERRYGEALGFYRRASAIEPHDSNLHYRICLTLHRLDLDAEARGECALALSSMPSDPDVQALVAELNRGGAPK